MKNINISVIVPVYNAEMYISRCIESIISQKFDSFEIILVNDGSFDKSGLICDLYEKSNSCIRVIHQANGGVSTARNAGINVAAGKYLCFVDADDILLPDALGNMWDCVTRYPNVDVVCARIHFENGTISSPLVSMPDYTEDKRFIRSKSLWELLNFSACARLVSKRLLDDYKIYFSPGITCGEDPLWVYFLHKHIRSVAQCRILVYQYFSNNNSSVMHQRDRTKHYASLLKCAAIACQNFGPDGLKAERAYILDLLNADRCYDALRTSDKEILRKQIEDNHKIIHSTVYRSNTSKPKVKKLPWSIRFSIWRLKKIIDGKDRKLWGYINAFILKMDL